MFSKDNKRIPDAELLVMQVIWKAPDALSLNRIIDKLQEAGGPGWSISTIRTLLSRLEKRGYLSVEKVDQERCYTAIISEQAYLKKATNGFLSQHYQNSIFRLVSTFADGRLTKEELQELKGIVSKLEE